MRLNSKQRRKLWDRVCYRELYLGLPADNVGPHCRGCGRAVGFARPVAPGDPPQGYIDCIDNSGDHSRFENLQILCPSCNRYKNVKRLGPELPRDPDQTVTMAMRINRREKLFRGWVLGKLVEKGKMRYDEALRAGGEKFLISTDSTKKYLAKMTSSEGPCPGTGTILKLRPDFDDWLEKRIEWEELLDKLTRE